MARLMANPHYRRSLLNIKDFPENPVVLQTAPLRSINEGYLGDADLIVVNPEHPSIAVAIEVKRIKVSAASFASGKPNKLREFPKAVQQANRLSDIGFALSYLFVLVVVDSRSNNQGEYTYDGATPELKRAVDAAISTERLREQVGLIVNEFVQSMDHPPLELGSSGGHLRRLARPVPQAAASRLRSPGCSGRRCLTWHAADSGACHNERRCG